MGAYYFVIATALAILPIAFLFKINIERLKEKPAAREKIQTNFFIGVAVIEIIPIILVVFGFMNLAPVEVINDLFLPGLIILALWAFGALFTFLQRTIDVTPETQGMVNIFSLICFAMMSSIPIISVVSLILMLPV